MIIYDDEVFIHFFVFTYFSSFLFFCTYSVQHTFLTKQYFSSFFDQTTFLSTLHFGLLWPSQHFGLQNLFGKNNLSDFLVTSFIPASFSSMSFFERFGSFEPDLTIGSLCFPFWQSNFIGYLMTAFSANLFGLPRTFALVSLKMISNYTYFYYIVMGQALKRQAQARNEPRPFS